MFNYTYKLTLKNQIEIYIRDNELYYTYYI